MLACCEDLVGLAVTREIDQKSGWTCVRDDLERATWMLAAELDHKEASRFELLKRVLW